MNRDRLCWYKTVLVLCLALAAWGALAAWRSPRGFGATGVQAELASAGGQLQMTVAAEDAFLSDRVLNGARRWLTLWSSVAEEALRAEFLGRETVRVRAEVHGAWVHLEVHWSVNRQDRARVKLLLASCTALPELVQRALWQALAWPAVCRRAAGDGRYLLRVLGLRQPDFWGPILIGAPRSAEARGGPHAPSLLLITGWDHGYAVGVAPAALGTQLGPSDRLVVLPAGLAERTIRVVGRDQRALPGAIVRLMRLVPDGAGAKPQVCAERLLDTDAVASFLLDTRYPHWLDVTYAGLRARQSLPAAGPHEAYVSLPAHRDRVLLWAAYQRLLASVRTTLKQRRSLLLALQGAVNAGDTAQVESLLGSLKQQAVNITAHRSVLEQLRQAARRHGEPVGKIEARIEELLERLERPVETASFEQWLAAEKKQQRVAELERRAQHYQQQMQWQELLETLRALAELLPENRELQRRLRSLEQLLAVRNEEHATARRWLERLMGQATYEDLVDLIDIIELQVEVLEQNEDALTLLRFQRAVQRWVEGIQRARERLQRRVAEGDGAARSELEELVELADRLARLVARVSSVVEGFRL